MPLFEYRCRECGEISEILVQARSKEKPACEHCGSTDLEKLLSTAAVHVRGNGPAACPPGGCCRDLGLCNRPEPCAKPPCAEN